MTQGKIGMLLKQIAIFALLLHSALSAELISGTWKIDFAKSNLNGFTVPKKFLVRLQAHAKGQLLTLDRLESDGRMTSSSTILYLDGKPRAFEDFECSGMQSSRRLDSETVEIRRSCLTADWTWRVRQPATQSKLMFIDITGIRRTGSQVDWRVVLEKNDVAHP